MNASSSWLRRLMLTAALAAGTLAAAAGCAPAGATAQKPSCRTPFVRELPAGPEYARLLAPPDSAGLRSGLVTLRPGEDCGWHSTEDHEEMIICLAGAGELRTSPRGRRALAAGQYAYNPPHTRHCVFNTGQENLRYIYVVAPAPHAVRPADEAEHSGAP